MGVKNEEGKQTRIGRPFVVYILPLLFYLGL
jgi:hypothetical protein